MSDASVFGQMGQVTEIGGNEFDWVDVPGFHERFPNLADVLFAKKNRGDEREGGRLLLFPQDGRVKVCITCPTEGVCAFTVIENPQTLCEELEVRLREGKLEWRPDKKSRGKAKAPF